MCLFAIAEVRNLFQPVPMRKIAWKVVQVVDGRRAPPYRDRGDINYVKGSVHSVSPKDILARREPFGDRSSYHTGLHVFTERAAADQVADSWNTPTFPHIVVRVAVDPADWIADSGDGEAVYARLKVLT
jgi:hypothetical protein